jgi:hypothetical protein
MPPLRFIALFCFSAASLCAQTASAPSAAAQKGTLEVARSGNEVLLTWQLPHSEVRSIEIFRNAHSDTKGRGRVGTVRSDITVFHDRAPDGQTYWYWIKLMLPDGTHANIGPVATPSGTVWTP